ncbi:MAG TPA: aldehyde dehydrogenase family protein [Nitrospiria bacterium]|nr:aldehyde dehydrogenase family protein [Nitrospiria bacterium]
MIKEYQIFLAGSWKPCKKAVEVTNPYDGEAIGSVHQAEEAEAEHAIRAAQQAFPELRRMPLYRRAEALRKITEGIRERSEELARMICREAGKPITDARGEVARAILNFQTAVEETKRLGGEVIPLDLAAGSESRVGIVRRFPIGPVLGISPFNFPLNLVGHKIAPAIASGNPIVLKPAPKTPVTALMLGEIIATAELPAGSVSILPCANELAQKMATDDRFKLLSFTGSAKVGWYLKSKAGKKKVLLELGGNAGVIIHRDADLDLAARRCAAGGFSYAGQSCISVQRIFVHEPVIKPFMDRFLNLVRGLKTGDPMDEGTNVGPMINSDAAERTEQWVEEAVRQGAKVLIGGKRRGRMFEPTVLTDVTPMMKVCSEEVFAPLVVVIAYHDFDEALSSLNNSAYGLQAGLFTNDLKKIFQAYEELEIGGLMVNEVSSYRIDPMPYGGVKDSGLGREGVRYAIEEMTEPKLLALNLQ